MTGSQKTVLVLGGTGRTGTLLANLLAERGRIVRTAARHGPAALFDWDNPATYAEVLPGADRLYLVTPVLRVTYAEQVAALLDLAEGTGVRHVTYLSAYGADQAPAEVEIRTVEARPGRASGHHPLCRAPGLGDAELHR